MVICMTTSGHDNQSRIMTKTRLEAFSDGVIAIIITIMVLEMKAPHEPTLEGLAPLAPVFISYVLSFLYVAIYWANHHHLLHAVQRVSGSILWANTLLLFWLSLIPFVTAWMGENRFATIPVVLYGLVLLCAAASYYLLVHTLLAHHGRESTLARAIGSDLKGKLSVVIYFAAIPIALIHPWISGGLYALVALIWLLPDRRIEKALAEAKH